MVDPTVCPHDELYFSQGLSRSWTSPIVCSQVTGRLITTFLRVPERLVITLEPGETRLIDRVEVTAVEARLYLLGSEN